MTHISQDSFILLNRRRVLERLALGGTAALALTACGGGGGDDSEGIDLRAAYDRVVEGMSVAQVTRVVGREPSEISTVSTGVGGLFWSDGNGQQLHVGIGDVTQTTTYVRWDRLTSPVATLRKDYT